MIIFWNQKEIFVGSSMERFSAVRQALAVRQIKYKYRVVNNSSPSLFASRRATFGAYGKNPDYAYMYYLYVHRKDYDQACAVLHDMA